MTSDQTTIDHLTDTLSQMVRTVNKGLTRSSFSIAEIPQNAVDRQFLANLAEVQQKQAQLRKNHPTQNLGEIAGEVYSDTKKVEIIFTDSRLTSLSEILGGALKEALGGAFIDKETDVHSVKFTYYGSLEDMQSRIHPEAFTAHIKRVTPPTTGFGLTGID